MMDDFITWREVLFKKKGEEHAKKLEIAKRKISEEKEKRRQAVMKQREEERERANKAGEGSRRSENSGRTSRSGGQITCGRRSKTARSRRRETQGGEGGAETAERVRLQQKREEEAEARSKARRLESVRKLPAAEETQAWRKVTTTVRDGLYHGQSSAPVLLLQHPSIDQAH